MSYVELEKICVKEIEKLKLVDELVICAVSQNVVNSHEKCPFYSFKMGSEQYQMVIREIFEVQQA